MSELCNLCDRRPKSGGMELCEVCLTRRGNLGKFRLLADVKDEIDRAEVKFGANRNHKPGIWLVILAEEFGEAARAILEMASSRPSPPPKECESWKENLRQELIQVAAVAVMAVDSFDRNEGKS